MSTTLWEGRAIVTSLLLRRVWIHPRSATSLGCCSAIGVPVWCCSLVLLLDRGIGAEGPATCHGSPANRVVAKRHVSYYPRRQRFLPGLKAGVSALETLMMICSSENCDHFVGRLPSHGLAAVGIFQVEGDGLGQLVFRCFNPA